MAINKHTEIVLQGSEAIEQWRTENPDVQLDLSDVNFRRADLTSSNLNGAIFIGANLEWTDFRWADLMDADFSGAKLARADFHKADCERAKFVNTDLSDTNFEDANLRNADFHEAGFSQTRMLNTDLGGANNLQTTRHSGPSKIDFETLMKSGYLPSEFLKGCGLSDTAIGAAHAFDSDALSSEIESEGEYYSCFISYSSQDKLFADKLYSDLQNRGVRIWFAPKDMRTGDKIRESIYEAIRTREKLLIILSEKSIESQWVGNEVEKALSEERDRKDTVLFPIQIDDSVMHCNQAWAETIRLARHIGDFRNWKIPNVYQEAFEKLISDLKK
jgi:hypothetical protein